MSRNLLKNVRLSKRSVRASRQFIDRAAKRGDEAAKRAAELGLAFRQKAKCIDIYSGAWCVASWWPRSCRLHVGPQQRPAGDLVQALELTSAMLGGQR